MSRIMRHMPLIAVAFWTLALVCALAQLAALPALADSEGSSEEGDIGSLTDRYSTLDELINSRNADEAVVVDTDISVLTSVNRALEGTTVRVTGEVVGQAINADSGHKWVSIDDNAGRAIAVLLTNAQVQRIRNYGNYHTAGTTIEVTGIYHIACQDHQGELDVHASSIRVIDIGGATTHAPSTNRFVIAVVLCALGFVFMMLFLFLRRRSELRGE